MWCATSPCAAISEKADRFAREADASIEIWDIVSKTKLLNCNKPDHQIVSMQFSPDGQRLIACSNELNWALYELELGALLASGKSNVPFPLSGAYFSLDGLTFVVVSRVDSSHFFIDIRSVDDGRILMDDEFQ